MIIPSREQQIFPLQKLPLELRELIYQKSSIQELYKLKSTSKTIHAEISHLLKRMRLDTIDIAAIRVLYHFPEIEKLSPEFLKEPCIVQAYRLGVQCLAHKKQDHQMIQEKLNMSEKTYLEPENLSYTRLKRIAKTLKKNRNIMRTSSGDYITTETSTLTNPVRTYHFSKLLLSGLSLT